MQVSTGTWFRARMATPFQERSPCQTASYPRVRRAFTGKASCSALSSWRLTTSGSAFGQPSQEVVEPLIDVVNVEGGDFQRVPFCPCAFWVSSKRTNEFVVQARIIVPVEGMKRTRTKADGWTRLWISDGITNAVGAPFLRVLCEGAGTTSACSGEATPPDPGTKSSAILHLPSPARLRPKDRNDNCSTATPRACPPSHASPDCDVCTSASPRACASSIR